jgi:hypothetical protein
MLSILASLSTLPAATITQLAPIWSNACSLALLAGLLIYYVFIFICSVYLIGKQI